MMFNLCFNDSHIDIDRIFFTIVRNKNSDIVLHNPMQICFSIYLFSFIPCVHVYVLVDLCVDGWEHNCTYTGVHHVRVVCMDHVRACGHHVHEYMHHLHVCMRVPRASMHACIMCICECAMCM